MRRAGIRLFNTAAAVGVVAAVVALGAAAASLLVAIATTAYHERAFDYTLLAVAVLLALYGPRDR